MYYNINMKIYIGSDHAGFELKEKLKAFLADLSLEVIDKGAYEMNLVDDYPDFVIPVATEVALDKDSFGIVLGGSGSGEQITANKITGIRAIEYYGGNLEIIRLGREHNDANVLSLGSRFIEEDEAREAVRLFLTTPFSEDERHIRRINKLEAFKLNLD
jgi:ribose 5-phosphate isomerase B